MKIAVIGRGLIGSAAARHLAMAGHDVVLIGPSEPSDKPTHQGVFASHYDEGRITRALDPSPFWSEVSRASIARYREIEAVSGVPFFSDVGAVMAGTEDGDFMRRVKAVRDDAGIKADAYQGAELAARFPYFHFPDGVLALHEKSGAGYISPRNLVLAQGCAAERAGALIVDATVRGLRETGGAVQIDTDTGLFEADRVLVAAGGFTNMILPNALPLHVYARTVALFEVSAQEAARLHAMPSLIYLKPNGEDPYLLPPIRYPDGKFYLKLGGDPSDDPLHSTAEIKEWFRGGGSPVVAEKLAGAMRERMPDLNIMNVHRNACVTTYTDADHPIIDNLSDRITVAVAGCGRGAKCSDELGRLGAEAIFGRGPEMLRLAS
ncbi:FAD-dependent oxidoreductase [Actibacterium lipolyticum]|uniref:Monomeric sarcosine oxidase n=1 Tax=Actibacterium lipolyticum TaxID=1524263 RepID=A0A238KR89_9RHOB|nr:FAD-dependent oxidoreductase [Actibacterium lipolyticum]SMX45167.1 Monomeric sarcosine oxidase [Actibacterium lipolyticum]